MKRHRLPNPEVLRWILIGIVAITIGVLLAYAFDTAEDNEDRLDRAYAERGQLQAELDAQQETSSALAQQVEQLGGKPIIDPDDADEPAETPESGDSSTEITQSDVAVAIAAYCEDNRECIGKDGRDGKDATVTPAMVTRAVARYCDARGDCEGTDGERGRRGPPGPPPSQTAILDAVETYCADGACVGPRGPAGDDGTDGDDSNVPGPQGEPGRPPTSEEIAGAVRRYCEAHKKCRGPAGPIGPQGTKGPRGPAGPKGEDGASIVETTCRPDGTWEFTYSNGTSSTSPGPCRIPEQPDPPTEDPSDEQ